MAKSFLHIGSSKADSTINATRDDQEDDTDGKEMLLMLLLNLVPDLVSLALRRIRLSLGFNCSGIPVRACVVEPPEPPYWRNQRLFPLVESFAKLARALGCSGGHPIHRRLALLQLSLSSNPIRLSTTRCGLCLQSMKRGLGIAIFTAECSYGFHPFP